MRHDLLPPRGATGGTPKKPTNAPAKVVAGHLMNKLGRPSRSRSRLLLSLILATSIFGLLLGRRHSAELQLAASMLSSYVPDRVTDAFAQYGGKYENTRWDDDVTSEEASYGTAKRPKFHLLIPANKPSVNLCKTMLSAAVLNYPPPTLINYGTNLGNKQPGENVVKNTFRFLLGKEVHESDLIFIIEEDAWLQLPAEVTINRFFHGMRDSSARLLEKYGTFEFNSSTASKRPQKYYQRVLFGAAKECSNGPSEPACYIAPESPLPKDIYGEETDKHPEGKYNRPRYMGSSMVMGRVSDLRPIYHHAMELLEFDKIGAHGSQYIFSKIFGEQELARQIEAAKRPNSRFRSFFSKSHSKMLQENITLSSKENYEYGIGLDYHSSIFQFMNNSAEDIRFISFNHPSIIASPSKLSASAFAFPISLPPDLLLTPPPFSQHTVSSPNPDPPITPLDTISDADPTQWEDVKLATNIIVPGSSVPASLNFHGSESLLDKTWEKMWFYKNARTLMRRYMRSPDGPVAAEAAAAGGEKWWDLRGGKGGVWTDRGEWLEWNEVCGGFDGAVFGDGKGEFGREEVRVGGQEVKYNSWGQVVEGKVKGGDAASNERVAVGGSKVVDAWRKKALKEMLDAERKKQERQGQKSGEDKKGDGRKDDDGEKEN